MDAEIGVEVGVRSGSEVEAGALVAVGGLGVALSSPGDDRSPHAIDMATMETHISPISVLIPIVNIVTLPR